MVTHEWGKKQGGGIAILFKLTEATVLLRRRPGASSRRNGCLIALISS